jgi:sulfite reductase (NADPH) flavoprotein alpha-component
MAGDQKQTFTGRHLVNVKLTGAGSEKDTRHHEIAIDTPGVAYLPGDALGVYPRNATTLVERVLARLSATGDEFVPGRDGFDIPFHRALTDVCNLTTPTRRLFEILISRGAADLAPLMDKANAEHLKQYLSGWNEAHDVLDVLEDHPGIDVSPRELVESLRKILPRLYSVASSLTRHPAQVHALVVSVRYAIRGRVREGICSTWMADRWPTGETADLYLQNQQKHFAMPASLDTPMIMIGPGTGLAPFRAFIEERQSRGARGRNWLFFGEQRSASEFFYADELTAHERDGFLRLNTAFSRDQAQKIYVQHRLEEQAHDVWAWLEEGAEVFVCGDKDRMAADVDAALHRIVETAGGRTPDQAKSYIEDLKKVRRYKRDVY